MLNNQKIADKYIKSLENPESSKKTIQTSVNIILNYLEYNNIKIEDVDNFNHIYLKDFEQTNNKSLFDIEIEDIKNFKKMLNDANNYTLTTKKSIFGTVKRFIRSFLKDYSTKYDNYNAPIVENSVLNQLKRMEYINNRFRKRSDLISNLNEKSTWITEENHKQSERNKDDIMLIGEYEQIIRYFQRKDIRKSYMFRILGETGMRRGELVSIDIEKKENNHIGYLEDDLDKRILRVKGKMGKKIYIISKELSKDLKIHLDTRKKMNVETKAFFVSTWNKRFCSDTINKILKTTMRVLGLNEQYTPHIFRKTLNKLRADMGASNEDKAILLNHKMGNMNFDKYELRLYKREEIIEKFDKYNPYKNLIF